MEPAAPEVAELRVSLAVRVVLAVWPLIAEAAVETVERVAQEALRVLAVAVAAAQRLACHVMAQALRLVRRAIAAALADLVAQVAQVVTPVQPGWLPTRQSPRSTGLKSGGPVLRAPKMLLGCRGSTLRSLCNPMPFFEIDQYCGPDHDTRLDPCWLVPYCWLARTAGSTRPTSLIST